MLRESLFKVENFGQELPFTAIFAGLSFEVIPQEKFRTRQRSSASLFLFFWSWSSWDISLSLSGSDRGKEGVEAASLTEAETGSMVVKSCLSLCRARLWKHQCALNKEKLQASGCPPTHQWQSQELLRVIRHSMTPHPSWIWLLSYRISTNSSRDQFRPVSIHFQ